MFAQQLTETALSLPLPERVQLAQALWESIDSRVPDIADDEAAREAVRRDEELSSGVVTGRAHREVMETARRVIGCK